MAVRRYSGSTDSVISEATRQRGLAGASTLVVVGTLVLMAAVVFAAAEPAIGAAPAGGSKPPCEKAGTARRQHTRSTETMLPAYFFTSCSSQSRNRPSSDKRPLSFW